MACFDPEWRAVTAKNKPVSDPITGQTQMYPKEYVVVPHPDNDPEAVRLIEEAQR